MNLSLRNYAVMKLASYRYIHKELIQPKYAKMIGEISGNVRMPKLL